jgi:hypothetical protein
VTVAGGVVVPEPAGPAGTGSAEADEDPAVLREAGS